MGGAGVVSGGGRVPAQRGTDPESDPAEAGLRLATAFSGCGSGVATAGDLARARSFYRENLALRREIGNLFALAGRGAHERPRADQPRPIETPNRGERPTSHAQIPNWSRGET